MASIAMDIKLKIDIMNWIFKKLDIDRDITLKPSPDDLHFAPWSGVQDIESLVLYVFWVKYLVIYWLYID